MESIREQIIRNLMAAVANVTLAAGYVVPVNAVQRFRYDGKVTTRLPMVFIEEGADTIDQEFGPGRWDRTLNLSLFVLCTSAEHDTEAVGSVDGAAMADALEAAIAKETYQDRERSGLAIDTYYDGREPIDDLGGEQEMALRMNYRIRYRTVTGDPFTRG